MHKQHAEAPKIAGFAVGDPVGIPMDKFQAFLIEQERELLRAPAAAPAVGGFALGDDVTVTCPGHRHDGRTGTVSYLGDLFVTVGVSIEGQDYGFFSAELTLATKPER